jgi:Ribbon-helix-helix protein, copG family
MRTTLTLDEDVAARLNELQRRLGISYKDAVNLTLRIGLEQQSAGAKEPAKFTVNARDMGLRPGLNYDNIGELLEQIEGVDHQ